MSMNANDNASEAPVTASLSALRLPLSSPQASSAEIARVAASETPLAVEIDGSPYAVMMVTPSDLEDFAVGFALAERLIESPSDIARIDVRDAQIRQGRAAVAVDVRLEEGVANRAGERGRSLPGQSGCGLCGIMMLEDALPDLDHFESCPRFTREAIAKALAQIGPRQALNEATAAVHAAAFCAADGSIIALREDVGRHNAFDKVVGHLAREEIEPSNGFALLTSRCSYELAQKAVLARIPMLVTISAPTELAVSIAKETNLTLVALARPDAALVFNDPFGIF